MKTGKLKKLKLAFSDNVEFPASERAETRVVTEFAQFFKFLQFIQFYKFSVYYPHPPECPLTFGEPTCAEEAEALKAAPPWRGNWITPPTMRQRLLSWLGYMTFKTGNRCTT